MTIGASGSISMTAIQSEFGGTNPIKISEYWNADPFKPTPTVGPIDLGSFRGTSIRTCQITSGYSSDYTTRYGWSAYKGSYYSSAEEGHEFAEFGATTRATNIVTGGNELCCVSVILGGYYDGLKFCIGMRGNNSDGFYLVDIKYKTGDYDGQVDNLYTDTATWAALPRTYPTAYGWVWSNTSANATILGRLWTHLSANRPIALQFKDYGERNR